MARYSLGLDYGTESARAVLVSLDDGSEAATHVAPYRSGVIDRSLPDSDLRLPPDWALQDPIDYLAAAEEIVPKVLRDAGVSPADVLGIGVDFTACTLVPCRADGVPLSTLPEWRSEPHAWTKLWKHHAAQPEAEALNHAAREQGERFLRRYGGTTSSEWLFAKAWQVLDEAPEVYAATDVYVEAGDWLVWQLTGQLSRSACQAGYKALWSRDEGYPSESFLTTLDPRLGPIVREKLRGDVLPVGARAGGLLENVAARLGLLPGTHVAVSLIDAHAAVPAAGVAAPGKLVIILGTSGCHLVLGGPCDPFDGFAGVVQDGILPGYLGYEAGQPATGDILAWFVRHAAGAEIEREAELRGVSPHQVLEERAAAIPPGGTGLLALDWWNGNRSVLMDADLSGVLVGLTLNTSAEQIYRALIEATAFGTRVIVENFVAHGVAIEEIIAAGGLSDRNELLMQIYADVTGRPIRVARSGQACAVGAAILGSLGPGGHPTLEAAVRAMGGVREREFVPDAGAHAIYTELYHDWVTLHDYFGRGGNDVLKRLRGLRER